MKNKFHSKQILLETKIFLSIVVHASDTVNVFNRFQQQSFFQSHENICVYLKLNADVKSLKEANDIH